MILKSGHEQKGKRPALVLSSKEYNQKSGLCLCVPLTSKIKNYPFEVLCLVQNKTGAILSDQIKSIVFKARKATFIQKCDEEIFKQTKNNLSLIARNKLNLFLRTKPKSLQHL
ncbi:MAG: type II toxin-antitoxin system PemK/MazF family toxin [Helicobacter sp.]|nr:type II toxin-antitoxin system PemK/MazF family toxin [Helicobacter sp.]